MNDDLSIPLSADAALVLLALIARLNQEEAIRFEDQAEQRVLWDLESALESTVVATFATDYAERLRRARDRVRDVD